MPGVLRDLLVGALAFTGTMLDDALALRAQLGATRVERRRSVARAHGVGVGVLVLLAIALASALAALPLRLVGVLALAPWYYAVTSWRHRGEPTRPFNPRRATTTLLATVALGGDSLVVWAVLLRASGVLGAATIVLAIAVGEMALVRLAPRLAARSDSTQPPRPTRLTPLTHLALGVLILFVCHVL